MKKIIVLLALALPLMYGCDKREEVKPVSIVKMKAWTGLSNTNYKYALYKEGQPFSWSYQKLNSKDCSLEGEFRSGDNIVAVVDLSEANQDDWINMELYDISELVFIGKQKQLKLQFKYVVK